MAKDTCIICGIETAYDETTHIDMRTGYVEGAGQGCFQPQICNDEKFYQTTKNKKK